MKLFDLRITLGNIIVLCGLAAGGIVTIGELRAAGQVSKAEIDAIKDRVRKLEEARDILLELRGDVKAMRSELNRVNR
jgi:outer membrane murein-binding lipoprotein Lpp